MRKLTAPKKPSKTITKIHQIDIQYKNLEECLKQIDELGAEYKNCTFSTDYYRQTIINVKYTETNKNYDKDMEKYEAALIEYKEKLKNALDEADKEFDSKIREFNDKIAQADKELNKKNGIKDKKEV